MSKDIFWRKFLLSNLWVENWSIYAENGVHTPKKLAPGVGQRRACGPFLAYQVFSSGQDGQKKKTVLAFSDRKERSMIVWPTRCSCYKKTDSRSYVRKFEFCCINTIFFRNHGHIAVVMEILP